jgi:hypothetical protein
MAETFDIQAFVAEIKGLAREPQRGRVCEESRRVAALVVREPTWKFRQQIYLKRLAKLEKFLAGEDVRGELTPSEAEAFALLAGGQAQALPAATTAAAAAASAGQAGAGQEPQGAERRQSLRIRMATRIRIRRESSDSGEVLEPANMSRGGFAMRTLQDYRMHETLLVDLHFRPGQVDSAMERRARVVRKVPPQGPGPFSYGLKLE